MIQSISGVLYTTVCSFIIINRALDDSRFTNSWSSSSSYLCTQNCPTGFANSLFSTCDRKSMWPSNMFSFAIKPRRQSVLVVWLFLKMISYAANKCLAVEYAHDTITHADCSRPALTLNSKYFLIPLIQTSCVYVIFVSKYLAHSMIAFVAFNVEQQCRQPRSTLT